MSYRTWGITVLAFLMTLLIGTAAVTAAVDPYFHYHRPLDCLEYPLNVQRERYLNNGIIKHFRYDALITGTSMTENFKASELDELFGVNSIKVPFSGAQYKEINENLELAATVNPDLKMVVRGLDLLALLSDKDLTAYDDYPDYLYDDNLFNDVNYVLNKTVLFEDLWPVLRNTLSGTDGTSFDEYGNWNALMTFGKASVDASYTRPEKADVQDGPEALSEEERSRIRENLKQNVTDLAEQNPEIEFYLFFTPYSIYYWDSVNQNGFLSKMLAAEKEAAEWLLEYENIHLYSFFDEFDMICDADNYTDYIHYGEWVNSRILVWMKEGKHRLTRENYQEYYDRVYDFYMGYDYDSLF